MINIPVKIPGAEKKLRSIGLMHFTVGFSFIISAAQVQRAYGQNGYLPAVPLLAVAFISVFYGAFRKKTNAASKYNFSIRIVQGLTVFGYAIAALFSKNDFYGTGFWLWAVIISALAFGEKTALQKAEVVFTDRGFDFPAGYRRKHVMWSTVADVTLRPDFLTIHYKDNRFLQFELTKPISEIDAANLQDFCHRQISSAVAAG